MASVITNIRTLRNAGILTSRTVRDSTLNFRRYNLIYGFNGSGKSTLSRMFACLQAGSRDERLPPTCEFEFELDDGTIHACPNNLSGLSRRVLVFNTDFIEQNLQWSVGRANPVFYIGREQARLAAELSTLEQSVPAAEQRHTSSSSLLRAREKAFATLKRERARLIADRLRLRGRRYEAPQFVQDIAEAELGDGATLDSQELDAFTATCQLDEAIPRVRELTPLAREIAKAVHEARELAGQTPGAIIIDELEQHPNMLLWVKKGSEYHRARELESCLLCGNRITPARRELLERALDDRLQRFLALVERSHIDAVATLTELTALRGSIPNVENIWSELRIVYQTAHANLIGAIEQAQELVSGIVAVLAEKKLTPTQIIDASDLEAIPDAATIATSLIVALGELNELLRTHNERVENFNSYQEHARLSIRRHFAATARAEYLELELDQQSADSDVSAANDALIQLRQNISRLRSQVQEHGPAADIINKLIESYLGHGELTPGGPTPTGGSTPPHENGKVIIGGAACDRLRRTRRSRESHARAIPR